MKKIGIIFKVNISLVAILILTNTSPLRGQAFQCGTTSSASDPGPNQGSGNCLETFEGMSAKCVEIQIHLINNTNNPMQDIPDEFILQFIEQVNLIFGDSKIRFSLGSNCPHRTAIPSITNDVIFKNKVGEPINFNPDPDLAWDFDAINVFFSKRSWEMVRHMLGLLNFHMFIWDHLMD
ncbi:MAG TPA: hypothetical protein PKD32_02055 [Saprospiraceae bacterium]|nr:hypothetical protein [Saprospiraceae bacterium]